MKVPKFARFPKLFPLKRRKKLHATTAVRRAPAIEDYDEEPQTKLSSAFIVVAVLHLVAVGGIYAFSSIKAHREAQEPVKAAPAILAKSATKLSASPTPKIEAANAVKIAALNRTTPAASLSTPKAVAKKTETPPPTVTAAAKATPKIYTVAKGENATVISRKLGVSTDDLLKLNKLDEKTKLQPGQTLKVPPKKAN